MLTTLKTKIKLEIKTGVVIGESREGLVVRIEGNRKIGVIASVSMIGSYISVRRGQGENRSIRGKDITREL